MRVKNTIIINKCVLLSYRFIVSQSLITCNLDFRRKEISNNSYESTDKRIQFYYQAVSKQRELFEWMQKMAHN